MIQLQQVSKTYRIAAEELTVLRRVNLHVVEGEFVSIMGPSGSGKSTLMHIIGCLDFPTEGTYLLDDANVTNRSLRELATIRNQKIGFIFQNFHLLPRMTAIRNVELPMMYAGIARKKRRERALQLLEDVGLADRAHHLPNELSGGQKQRVAIARALANQPKLLLADEPTGALDSTTGQEIMNLFSNLNQNGMTILLITHDHNVASYANRMIRLADGAAVGEEVLRGTD